MRLKEHVSVCVVRILAQKHWKTNTAGSRKHNQHHAIAELSHGQSRPMLILIVILVLETGQFYLLVHCRLRYLLWYIVMGSIDTTKWSDWCFLSSLVCTFHSMFLSLCFVGSKRSAWLSSAMLLKQKERYMILNARSTTEVISGRCWNGKHKAVLSEIEWSNPFCLYWSVICL